MKQKFTIRAATQNDVPLILQFIRELAAYEKLSHEVTATEELLQITLFTEPRKAEVLLAYEHETSVGFAVFFHNFSTFLGKPGIYLEDLYVRPEFRGKGYGKSLLIHVARLARERDCGRFEWSVLDWNKPSIDFYQSLGATAMTEWTIHRVTGQALASLAARHLSEVE
jgi:GNAT superfamily N-acetyltransferase